MTPAVTAPKLTSLLLTTAHAPDTYSRDTLKDHTIPFMILSDAENPLTIPISRRDPVHTSRPSIEPSDTARLRFTVRGNTIAVRALLEHGASGISLFDLVPSFESAHSVSTLALLHETFPNARILTKIVDITSEDAVARGVSETVSELGSVDILLCFAGVVGTVHASELTLQQWTHMLDINTTGGWICVQAAGKQMIKQNTGGSILFTASISAHSVNYPRPAAAQKLARREWARYGIRVNSISPEYMDTALNEGDGLTPARDIWTSRNPMGRMGDPSELAGVVILLCSPAGKYINGADIVVDGSSTRCRPSVVLKFLTFLTL
ncbi:hypothetical protein FB451DRAFT_1302299 [Mycena latifolia]|nr:hypothetical protein FB451DRAFT_1302299 [Mycena latifolia]